MPQPDRAPAATASRVWRRRLTPRLVVGALGGWLAISAFAWRHSQPQRISCVVAGLMCVGLAWFGGAHQAAHRLCLAVGAWILLSLFIIWPGMPLTAWSNVLTGMGISVMSTIAPGRPLIPRPAILAPRPDPQRGSGARRRR
jgi:hypothetical protein